MKRAFVIFNPQVPVAQKIADELVFRRFQGDGVEFFILYQDHVLSQMVL